MKKKLKSLIALALVAIMVAGCGNTTKQEEPSKESSSKSTEVSQSATEEAQKYPDYLNLDGYRPIVKEGEKVTLKVGLVRPPVAETNLEDTWFYNFIEQKLNIDLEVEILTDDNLDARKNLMMVDEDEMPDLLINMSFDAAQIVNYGVAEGRLMPLSDWFSEELTPNILAVLEGQDAAILENTATDGKMYTLPTFYSERLGYGDTLAPVRLFVDTKYTEAAGITELPTTLEGFADMLRAFKALDPAELGVEKIYPMVASGSRDSHYILNAFGFMTDNGLNTTNVCWDVVEGQITVPALDEKYADYLTYMNMLYEEGLIHPDYFTVDPTALDALYVERAAGVVGIAAPYVYNADVYDEYLSMGIMTSDVKTEPYVIGDVGYGMGYILVSASTKYPEVCMRFLDYLYTDEGILYAQQGPVAGSEDTLGIVPGFEITDAGKWNYGEHGYSSLYNYRMNEIVLWAGALVEDGVKQEAWRVSRNEEWIPEALNPENGDQNYRLKVVQAFEGYEDYMVTPLPASYTTPEQSARFIDLQSSLRAYVDAETAKFIVGERDLSTLDKYYSDLEAMGAKEFLELAREIYASYEGPTQ